MRWRRLAEKPTARLEDHGDPYGALHVQEEEPGAVNVRALVYREGSMLSELQGLIGGDPEGVLDDRGVEALRVRLPEYPSAPIQAAGQGGG